MGTLETTASRRNAHLTFRANSDAGRHGWLRLTPAYSHELVRDALAGAAVEAPVVLDPFAGSGTTGLVAAEQGLESHLVDVNPFLVWLARAKARAYAPEQVDRAADVAEELGATGPATDPADRWQPALHRIERWWAPAELGALRVLRHGIEEAALTEAAADLLRVALCRTLIAVSNAAFDHQSMSFAAGSDAAAADPPPGPRATVGAGVSAGTPQAAVWRVWPREVAAVLASARRSLPGRVEVHRGDARCLTELLPRTVDLLYTSPPYANRMSYVRELRPYMYWLGHLAEPRDAGELDWAAVGGTWGVATSRVALWEPHDELPLDGELARTARAIRASGRRHADLLARYVHKYVADMWEHFRAAAEVVAPGGRAVYVVGNSSFFGEVVPVQDWYARLLTDAGFVGAQVTVLRKRNSKKALYEYAVEARRP